MAADQLWPDEAREAVARAIASCSEDPVGRAFELDNPALYEEEAEAVLAVLSAHAVPRAEHEAMETWADRGHRNADSAADAYTDLATEYERFRQAVLDLAKQWDQMASAGDASAEWFATELRALAGGEQ